MIINHFKIGELDDWDRYVEFYAVETLLPYEGTFDFPYVFFLFNFYSFLI